MGVSKKEGETSTCNLQHPNRANPWGVGVFTGTGSPLSVAFVCVYVHHQMMCLFFLQQT